MRKPTSHRPAGESLIALAQRGDERAFARLVREHEDMVYRFSFSVCRDQEKAAETVQDTFINVYRKLKQFDGRSKFSTWLYSIVVNNCLMKRRRGKLQRAMLSIDTPEVFRDDPLTDEEGNVIQTVPSWKETPHDLVVNDELKAILDRAILKLPVEYGTLFGRPVLFGFRTTTEYSKALSEIIALDVVDDRVVSQRWYFFSPELIEYAAKLLGVPAKTWGYSFDLLTPENDPHQ